MRTTRGRPQRRPATNALAFRRGGEAAEDAATFAFRRAVASGSGSSFPDAASAPPERARGGGAATRAGEYRARLRRRRARAGGRLRRGPGGRRERRPQLHQRRSRRHERRGERRPPPRRPSRGRLPGARGWLGVRADTRTETRRRRTRNGCARGGATRATREGCDAASVDVHRTFSAPGKKSAFTDAANTQGRSPHRAVRVSAKRPSETLATRAPRCGPSRDGDASNPCVPLTQGVITVEPERENIWFCSLGIPKLVGERPFARKLEGAELLPEGMSRFPSRRVRGRPRARLAGLALALTSRCSRRRCPARAAVEPAARGAARADLARLREEACAGHCRACRRRRGEGSEGEGRGRTQTRAVAEAETRETSRPGARRMGCATGHVTRGGSGRDGLGALRDADSFSARRRKLLVDRSAAASEAANASNAVWPKLAEVPPLLRQRVRADACGASRSRGDGCAAPPAALVDRRRRGDQGGARVR